MIPPIARPVSRFCPFSSSFPSSLCMAVRGSSPASVHRTLVPTQRALPCQPTPRSVKGVASSLRGGFLCLHVLPVCQIAFFLFSIGLLEPSRLTPLISIRAVQPVPSLSLNGAPFPVPFAFSDRISSLHDPGFIPSHSHSFPLVSSPRSLIS